MTVALSVEGLTKTYANGVTALNHIHLEVAKGDFFALLGPNGAGKSTTIGIICSLVIKTSGRVRVFGHDIDTHLSEAKSHIGVVPQEVNFSMFENVRQILLYQAGYYGIPRTIAKERADLYLHEMGLWSMREQAAVRLSGGMKRRLMIARALMNEPKLLILDEPTAGVDIELRHKLWAFLTKLNQQGTTIILTTHYLEEAEQLCKNVAIINDGNIVERANMKQLLHNLYVQTLILDISDVLVTIPPLPGFDYQYIDDTTLEVTLHRGQTLNQLFQTLTKHGINVISMRNKTNRLEELFMTLVRGEP